MKALIVWMIGMGFSAATPPHHRPEIANVQLEMQAECIAILLHGVYRFHQHTVARRYVNDPLACTKAMASSHDIPMKGEDWLRRLDVARSEVSP